MGARLVAVGIAVLGLCACGGNAPTAPSVSLPPTTSIVQVSVTGDELVWIGSAPAALTVKLITSLNPLEFLPTNDAVVWSVEPAGILTVDQRGSITGVRAGIATVSARYGDKIGSLKVRSMPNFAGRWSGRYQVVKCSGNTANLRTCFNQIAPGTWPMTLVLSQDNDHVSGTLDAQTSFSGPVVGTVTLSGALIMNGSVDQSMLGLEPRTMDWSSTILSSGAMTGSFKTRIPHKDFFGVPGYLLLTESELTVVTRAQ